jgi:hypothetical protein
MANRSLRDISTPQQLQKSISKSLKEIDRVQHRIKREIKDEKISAAYCIRHYGDGDTMLGIAKRVVMLNWCKRTLQEISKRLIKIERHMPEKVRESSIMSTLRWANLGQEHEHRRLCQEPEGYSLFTIIHM